MEGSSVEGGGSSARSSTIKDFSQLRSRLLDCLDRLMGMDRASADSLEDLRSKIELNRFNLVVVGQFKRGKTCLINALIGVDILPVAVIPLTSIVTVLTYGERVRVEVHYMDGRVEPIETELLSEYVTETGNPRNERGVREVVIHYPSPYLRDGVRLIDTPGVGSVYLHNTDVAYEYLPKCDAALFLLSVEQPASRAELDFLRDVREYSGKIFFLLNKIDYLSEPEVIESITFSRQVLSEAMGADVKVFPVSAKLALRGKVEVSEELLLQSRLAAFSGVLDDFLMHEKGKTLLLAASGQLLRTVSQDRLAADLELKTLSAPIEELMEKIGLIEARGAQIILERERIGLLMEGELDRLVREILDPEMARFTEELRERLKVELQALFDDHQDVPPRELDTLLESHVEREVEKAYRGWRLTLEKSLAEAFEKRCTLLAEKTNEIIDVLMRYASELFEVPFESSTAAGFWSDDSKFHFKLKEDPVGLDLVASSITGALPGLVARRFERLRAFLFLKARTYFLRKRLDQMAHVVGMQAGRVRYDLVERLKKSGFAFRKDLQDKIEAAVRSVGQAVRRGIERREEGEREARERQSELSARLVALDEVRAELLAIREGAMLR